MAKLASPRVWVLCVGLVFFCQVPFVGALEIHHLFADVDHDGHQHSPFDLCQWVQHHIGSGAFVSKPPIFDAPLILDVHLSHPLRVLFSTLPIGSDGSRAPPFS